MTGAVTQSGPAPKRRLDFKVVKGVARGGTEAGEPTIAPWPVLVVDDDPQVHAMTRVLLRDFGFQGRGFEVIEAHSAVEARRVLAERADIPLMLLDVVMETDDAGLSLARHIRHELGDRRLRIILRTGQPGQAPEREVMLAYDIDDYRAKTELTAQKLFTAVIGALRSWIHIDAIERLNATLEARVDARTRELAEARAFAENLIEMLPNPVWAKDRAGAYLLYNRAFREFFAIDETSWQGRTAAEMLGDKLPQRELSTDSALIEGSHARIEFETQLADALGRIRTLVVAKGALRVDQGAAAGIIGVITDITELKNLEHELRRLATTDALTGAANRRHFVQAASQEAERAARYATPLSVVMLDIDLFKRINDTWGHAMGDEVLRKVVEVIQPALREIDLLGRLGGEEFAVLLPQTALDRALAVAERLRAAIAAIAIPVADGTLTLTASMGVAERKPEDGGIDHLLGRADTALYAAKEGGRDRVRAA